MQNLLKNPWISLGSTPDHKAVTSGLLFHPNHILCTENIPISNDWNGHSLFHLPDDIPVCFSGIILLSRSSMYSNSRHSTAFRNLCDFHCIEERPFEILDFNMGCPVPKVVNNREGSALMKDPKLVEEILTKLEKQ